MPYKGPGRSWKTHHKTGKSWKTARKVLESPVPVNHVRCFTCRLDNNVIDIAGLVMYFSAGFVWECEQSVRVPVQSSQDHGRSRPAEHRADTEGSEHSLQPIQRWWVEERLQFYWDVIGWNRSKLIYTVCMCDLNLHVIMYLTLCLQCSDTVDWATGRASGL